jgi:hypothetical protein
MPLVVGVRSGGSDWVSPNPPSSLAGMGAGETVVLTVVSGGSEAEVVCGLLRSAGIECAYRDTDAIDSSLEDFMSAGPREVVVRASDLQAAQELLAAQEG